MDQSHVTVDDAKSCLTWYRAAEGGDRGFCGNCGSPMFFKSARYPSELHVARALFCGPVDRLPQGNAFYDTHVDWVTLAEPLPVEEDPK